MAAPTFLGLDLSTQQLKGVILNSDLKVEHEAYVDFDAELAKYGTKHGVHVDQADGNVITSPVAMWLAAIDILMDRLSSYPLSSVVAMSGAGMQHGTIYWSAAAERAMQSLDSKRVLADQDIAKDINHSQHGALALAKSPNWQDSSTSRQCQQFEDVVGGADKLASITGNRAHQRFSGPQILKVRETQPETYQTTARISLVSSFLATIFLGKFAPIDVSDACGTNLFDIKSLDWHQPLLELTAGGKHNAIELRNKLGEVNTNSQSSLGNIASYFVERYGFRKDCEVFSFTGDNPSTLISLPLKEDEAIISLGTSTTFLMSTSNYRPHFDYHFMHHPTTAGLYMFMLCYKNGSLAREQIRDAIDPTSAVEKSWAAFDTLLSTTPVLGKLSPNSPARLGVYFPRAEILPMAGPGRHRALYTPGSSIDLLPDEPDENVWDKPNSDARAIVESQFLSVRLRIQEVAPKGLKRIYLVGGASSNRAIAQICGEVLGAEDGIWTLKHTTGGACAVGAANRAAWGWETDREQANHKTQSFEQYLTFKWANDSQRLLQICRAPDDSVWKRYGEALDGLKQLEKLVLTTT